MIVDPEIRENLIKVIQYSQNIPEPQVDQLICDWYINKKEIINTFFNGKLSITSPEKVIFVLNDDAKAQRLDGFIEYVSNLLEQGGGWEHAFIRYLNNLTVQEFYDNSLANDYNSLSFSKKIPKGTKVIKSFKYFLDDSKLLNDIQSKASELIQENKVEGYLVFSVHPLDFLSSSENCFNWRSCHALDGEYRAGNLSYMCDKSTIVCYLRSEDEKVKLPHFPEDVLWNNKKWRMLIHFSDDLEVAFAGRQYPFTSPGALEVVREVLFVPNGGEIDYGFFSKQTKWSHWHNDYLEDFEYQEFSEDDANGILPASYMVLSHKIFQIEKIVKDAENSRHFNDLLKSSCYEKPYYIFKKKWISEDLKFNIGKEIKCLRCGENTIDGMDSMMCPDCECQYGESDSEEYRACDCCGIRYFNTSWSWVEEAYVCPSCLKTETFKCEECGELHFNAEKYYDEETKEFLCNCCFEKRNEE